jgi:hypothetical protein
MEMDQAIQCGDRSGNKDQAVWRWIRQYEYGSGSMELDQVPIIRIWIMRYRDRSCNKHMDQAIRIWIR